MTIKDFFRKLLEKIIVCFLKVKALFTACCRKRRDGYEYAYMELSQNDLSADFGIQTYDPEEEGNFFNSNSKNDDTKTEKHIIYKDIEDFSSSSSDLSDDDELFHTAIDMLPEIETLKL